MIDYSSKHNVILEDRGTGCQRRMDEPYFKSELIGDRVWKIESDGCISYMIEGEKESVVIDTGYGCGNIRAFCQTLTNQPVLRVINTHDHFDHTALNSYFECAVMSEETEPLATMPFKSFEGIEFPRNYKKMIVKEGDIIDLGNRNLEVFKIPDHAVGSIALLDRKGRMLFIGDEIGMKGKDISTSVEKVGKQFEKLISHREEYDWVCHGHMGKMDAEIVERVYENIQHILGGSEGEVNEKPHFRLPEPREDGYGNIILTRDAPHPGDMTPKDPEDEKYVRVSKWADCEVKYDIRRVFTN